MLLFLSETSKLSSNNSTHLESLLLYRSKDEEIKILFYIKSNNETVNNIRTSPGFNSCLHNHSHNDRF